MTSLVLVSGCAFRHELMAMPVMQITTAANIANVDPVTKAGFSTNQIDVMSRPTSATATNVVVRPFRVVIKPLFKAATSARPRRQSDEDWDEAL
jgi:hypothetical protein